MDRRVSRLFLLLLWSGLLAGCDLLGIEGASAIAARKAAEGKAIGGACRHAGRAIEDCYTLNKRADKAAVFTGWREMDDYMRENKIEAVSPQLPTAAMQAAVALGAPPQDPQDDAHEVEDAPAKPANKAAAAKH
jgi:hypothetical protein